MTNPQNNSVLKKRQERGGRSDPNVMQRAASDSDASVWVNASAGTGKTKVLTDRLIRLMLPKPATEALPERAGTLLDRAGILLDRAGTPPHRILCLTYTKAGAGEMLNRIMETLSKWAALSDFDLRKTLAEQVLGYDPLPSQMQKARSLFAEVVDTAGGIKIMTIHSFCQSLLGRFPVEANLPPNFSLMGDDETRRLMTQARDSVLKKALSPDHKSDSQDFHQSRVNMLLPQLITTQNSAQLSDLLKMLSSQRQKIRQAVYDHGGIEALAKRIYDAHDLPPLLDETAVVARLARQFSQDQIEALSSWLESSTKTWDVEKAARLRQWLAVNDLRQVNLLSINSLGDLLAALRYRQNQSPTKGLQSDRPDLYEQYLTLCERVQEAQKTLQNFDTAWKSEATLHLAAGVIDEYDRLKTQQNLLDYDDLILKVVRLLHDAPEWVMFKLDGGIDHVLVDEAQDSNAEQWTIIRALIQEFISGKGQNEEDIRSLFVVGDEKQSIFGFQGADPDVFQEMRYTLAQDFKAAGLLWRDQPLNVSFRSVQAVLNVVDDCFLSASQKVALTGQAEADIYHEAFRDEQAGHVELWPLIIPDEKPLGVPWAIPTLDQISSQPSPQRQLAQNIATEIKSWLTEQRPLKATGAPVRAGDIMILVRRRNSFVDHMIRALKDQAIPVSGVDRMVLGSQIAVQDMLSLARFTLLQDDDLTLACILKSPFIGLSEEQLQVLCVGRKGSLWQTLKNAAKNENHTHLSSVVEWLASLVKTAPRKGAHDFFSDVLQMHCPQPNGLNGLQNIIHRLGEDCLDAIEEFLSRCFDFDLKYRSDLQHFLHHFEQSDEDIKREIDEGQDVVRIMTVHGSKGLQSPIVFLPDSVLLSSDKGRVDSFLWAHDGDDKLGAIPLWSNSSKIASELYQSHYDALYERRKQEYERLLYVALTRAEDELYICGALNSPSSKVQDHSWYNTVKGALEANEATLKTPCPYIDNERLVYQTEQITDVVQKKKTLLSLTAIDENERHALLSDDFLGTPPIDAGPLTKPLSPSRPSDEDTAQQIALSPLKASDHTRRFKRGTIIHALLQFLPDTAVENRHALACRYLERNLDAQSRQYQEEILSEVFHILDHPDYAPLFSGKSKAEVPLTGIVDLPSGEKTVVSGQIDRLMIDHDARSAMIVDYKTNRPAPKDSDNIPHIYRKQMHCYRLLLRQLYPDYDIRTYILWTDHGMMMECLIP